MRWDEVVKAITAALKADTALATALGATASDKRIGPIEYGEERRIPSVRYQIISDVEDETMNEVIVQVDLWAQGRLAAATIERLVRNALISRTRKSFAFPGGEVEMWVLFLDARDAADPLAGVVRRSLDFRCVPVRAGLTTS